MRIEICLLLISAITIASTASEARADFNCPQQLGGSQLDHVSFYENFDGTEFELAPESEGDIGKKVLWMLPGRRNSSIHFVCSYVNGVDIEVRLPDGHGVTCHTGANHDGTLAEKLSCEF